MLACGARRSDIPFRRCAYPASSAPFVALLPDGDTSIVTGTNPRLLSITVDGQPLKAYEENGQKVFETRIPRPEAPTHVVVHESGSPPVSEPVYNLLLPVSDP